MRRVQEICCFHLRIFLNKIFVRKMDVMLLLLFHHHHHDKQIFSRISDFERLVRFKYFFAGFSCSGALMFLNIQF